MGYQKQNFADGQVLNSAHLNHIEDGLVAVNQRMANLTNAAVEFGEVTGNGNILFNAVYTEKPLYQLLVDDGSTVLVTFQMQGNAYIGAALSGAGATTKTMAIFYCCGAEDADV